MTQHRISEGQNPQPRRCEKLKIRTFYLLSERILVTFNIRGLHRSVPKEYNCEDYRLSSRYGAMVCILAEIDQRLEDRAVSVFWVYF
jgi:hypothetical protein